MKYFATTLTSILFAAAPLIAVADVKESELKIMHVLGQIAVITAEKGSTPVACALISTKESVRVNEPFTLVWNSFGAVDPSESTGASQWERGGATTVVVSTPGIKRYRFTFYAKSGEKATCMATVSVIAR